MAAVELRDIATSTDRNVEDEVVLRLDLQQEAS
jgi:hypothetical protein